jgi:hypothetical protein
MRIRARLPSALEAAPVAQTTKLPVKARSHSEALLWRTAELGQSALEAFRKDKLASATILTRALVETSAALWFVAGKMAEALKAQDAVDLDGWLTRMLTGSGTNPDLPDAIDGLEHEDSAIHSIKIFRHNYAVLSQFTHPDWTGTRGLYSDAAPQPNQTPRGVGLVALSLALEMAEHSYRSICEALPDITQLCEKTSPAG